MMTVTDLRPSGKPLTTIGRLRSTVASDFRGRAHLLPASVAAAGALVQFLYVRQGGFFNEDFKNLGQTRAGLSIHLLASPIAGIHFQPGGRFMQWLVLMPFHASYVAAAALLAIFSGMAAYLLTRLLDCLFGTRTLHLGLGFLLATSWMVLNSNQWFSGADTVPAAAFAIGACLGFCVWLRGAGRGPYVAAVLVAVAAVLFWEQALAIPALLLLLWVCFARDSPRSARQIILALLPFLAISVAYLAYVTTQPWHPGLLVPPLSQWPSWFWMPISHALAPTLIGSDPSPASTTWGSWSVIATIAGVAVIAAWLIARRRFRPSGLLFFVAGAVLVILPVATNRRTVSPVWSITQARYWVFLVFVTMVAIAGAIRRESTHARGLAWRSLTTGMVVVLVGLYMFNLNHTFNIDTWFQYNGQAAEGFATRVGNGLAALRPSQRTSVVDSVLPWPVWYITNDGQNELSHLIHFWSSTIRTFGEGRTVSVLNNGTLTWATFKPGGPGPKVVRVTVRAYGPTIMIVRIRASAPSEPETPWRIPVGRGVHSFTLPAWSAAVQSVKVTGALPLRVEVGTLAMGRAVSASQAS